MSSEADLGITEFLSAEWPGFNGLIKERFSDFNVYEIDKSGEIVKLDNQEIPKDSDDAIDPDPEVIYSELTNEQKALINEIDFSMIKMVNKDKTSFDPIKINVSEIDKDGRKEIHNIIKKFSNIDSNTTEEDSVKYIVARPKKKSSGWSNWPRERPKYLHFSLYKENMEVSEAISLLANKCRSQEKYFGFAGTKDRRGRTLQKVSVSMVSAQQIIGAAKNIFKIKVGNFRYDKKEIRLGDLTGNRFEILIRNVDISKSTIEPVMKSLHEIGFINYFGTQRFGTFGVPTHFIGKELIKANYSGAIDLILSPREKENLDCMKKARTIWFEEKDANKALKELKNGRKDRTIEGKLLYGLSKQHEKDLVGALEAIPRPQRLLYCHAYQSFIWNKIVSRRIKEHGTKVLKGDLVYKKNFIADGESSKDDQIEVIDNTEDFSINDVLIPIPGTKVKYPENEVKDWFEQYLAEDKMGFESFKNSVKDYNLPGDYRCMIVKPGDLQWELRSYSKPSEDLIPSAKEKIEQKDMNLNSSTESEDAKFKALIVKFSLPSSCYATMLLREVMKVETDRASLMKTSQATKRFNCDNNVDNGDNKVPKLQ